jgi:hypothetical protein
VLLLLSRQSDRGPLPGRVGGGIVAGRAGGGQAARRRRRWGRTRRGGGGAGSAQAGCAARQERARGHPPARQVMGGCACNRSPPPPNNVSLRAAGNGVSPARWPGTRAEGASRSRTRSRWASCLPLFPAAVVFWTWGVLVWREHSPCHEEVQTCARTPEAGVGRGRGGGRGGGGGWRGAWRGVMSWCQ